MRSNMAKVLTIETTPYTDQKPGTSGLRKKVPVFQQKGYLENFIQATFTAIKDSSGETTPLAGSTLVLGGDGRYYLKHAVQVILKMARASGVAHVIVGADGILSTPAVSALIRRRGARGGIILTASHNPGGPTEDFGVKYNISNGGPAPESVTSKIFAESKAISSYQIAEMEDVDVSSVGTTELEGFKVEVVKPEEDYVNLMKELFDFEKLKAYLSSNVTVLIDCMHGVAGPYATRIFIDELGCPASAVVNNIPKEDFGGGHPDPNLTYAADLVNNMKTGSADLGVAFDGDADRNMILGKKAFFVTPSDSVAVIAANYKCIPYLAKAGVKGLSRSMPTSVALNHVAEKLGIPLYEVPTGWKFFGNLMDADLLSICGEESFGTGSNHIREKDGVWAALCWLSIMAEKSASVEDVMMEHWNTFGRNFFARYDYEGVSSESAQTMMSGIQTLADSGSAVGQKYSSGHVVKTLDNFAYTDVTNGEVTEKQGLRFVFEDGSRIVFRLSGTGSSGATIRLYVDSYVKDTSKYGLNAQDVLKPLIQVALEVSKLQALTGREGPTVIT